MKEEGGRERETERARARAKERERKRKPGNSESNRLLEVRNNASA